ncbi:Zinc/iron permease, partial [Chytridium lagenaria]
YDTKLHVMAMFVIMAVSSLGLFCLSLLKGVESLPFQCAKLFGGGVIFATAFVHMLSPANELLTNPCLPTFFTETYTSTAAAIALFGALLTHLIQLFASRLLEPSQTTHHHDTPFPWKPVTTPLLPKPLPPTASPSNTPTPTTPLPSERRVTTYILELGIVMHSVIIGLALGVTREKTKTLLAALAFHLFEGVALSTIVIETGFKRKGITWVMVLLYVASTPIGIGLGIALNSTYNANALANLMTQGILEALAAGILTYDALVNILFHHF